MKHKTLSVIIIMVLIVMAFTGCAPKEPLIKTTYALGTVITINLFDEGDEALMTELISRITEIEQLMSMQKEDSEISAVTAAAGSKAVQVSEETYLVIKRAIEYAKMSDGSFDPTIGPVVDLWKIGTEDARLPEASEIEAALEYVDYSKVVLNDEEMSVYLPEGGMSLDLGGIAKGYAADEVIRLLDKAGISRAMIDLGGNIYAYGEKEGGENWNVGVRTPYDNQNSYFGYIPLKDMTVVTSGPYERYFEQDGNIYHHIFDARTGYPTEADVVSVSITAERSIDADALSTLLFTMEPEEGLALIESLDGTECLYLYSDYKVLLSSGLRSRFVLTDERYEIIDVAK